MGHLIDPAGSLVEIVGPRTATTGTPFTLACAHNTGRENVTYQWYKAEGVRSVKSEAGEGEKLVVENPQVLIQMKI